MPWLPWIRLLAGTNEWVYQLEEKQCEEPGTCVIGKPFYKIIKMAIEANYSLFFSDLKRLNSAIQIICLTEY